MTESWVPFHVALSMVTESIGSQVLAWAELPRLLSNGHVRAIAECTDIHEVTGERMRVYDVALPQEWWSAPRRFHRSAINSRLYLMVEREEQYEDGGYWFYKPHVYDRIRIFVPDLTKHIPVRQTNKRPRTTPEAGNSVQFAPTETRRSGPKPKKYMAILEAMRQLPRSELELMREKDMEHIFKASRDTCRRARNEILSKLAN